MSKPEELIEQKITEYRRLVASLLGKKDKKSKSELERFWGMQIAFEMSLDMLRHPEQFSLKKS